MCLCVCVCVCVIYKTSGSAVKNLPAMQETQEMQVQTLSQEDPLENEIATHPQ